MVRFGPRRMGLLQNRFGCRLLGLIILLQSFAMIPGSLQAEPVVLFADDFSQHEANGAPSSQLWAVPTGQTAPEREIRVVSEGVESRFGVAGNALRIYKNEQSIATASTAVTANNRFSHGAQVVTVAFDFWENPVVGPGSTTLRLGIDAAQNDLRVHEVQFNKGTLSGVGSMYPVGQAARIEIVINNSFAPVVYADGAATVASDTYDVWVNGVLVLSDRAPPNRGGLPVGAELTSLQFASFTSNRSEFWVRNLRVYEGGVVTPVDEVPPVEIFLAPDGDDANDGLSPAKPILTIARAQQILASTNAPADAFVRIAPGRYYGQQVVWTYSRPDRRVVFEPLDPDAPMPVFDGCSSGGGCMGGTWLRLDFTAGRHTNLEFRHLRFENYQTALSFNGNRNDENGYNGGNVVYGCYFYRIGNVFNPSVAASTAVIRLVNSKDNLIENNDFVDAINTTGGGLLHAVYVAHLSDRNFILQNRFINHSGDAVRMRDYSNDNVAMDNVFIRAGADGYSEWYCDQDARDDCTKPTPECPSWGNQFRDNILVSSYTGGTLGTFRYHQGDSTTGCSPPSEDAVRLRTSGNVRIGQEPIDLWRHRYFLPAERGNPALAGDEAAPAGDGIPNLLKYALGLNPRRSIRSGDLPEIDLREGRQEISFWRNLEAGDVETVVEQSVDLVGWSDFEGEWTEVEHSAERTRVKVRGAETVDQDRNFLRLKVHHSAP